MTDSQATMSFREHLIELRRRVLRATLAMLVGFGGAISASTKASR